MVAYLLYYFPMSKEAVIVFAHGARDPAWAEPLRRVCLTIRGRQPALRVELAFLEFMTPSLGQAIDTLVAEGVSRIAVMPAFLSEGGHVKRDLPEMLEAARQRHPGASIAVVPAMGESAVVIDAIADYAIMAIGAAK